MRELNIGTKRYTKVVVLDEPGQGNACHVYNINALNGSPLGNVAFQDGPIKEVGVNGVHNEDLIAIVIDRLQGFQSGKFSCRENALALTKLEEAMHWLNHRTNRRIEAGVEGTHQGS
jgi:hypothetical protein